MNFLNDLKEQVLDAFTNQDYQFEMLVEKLGHKRDLSRNALFDVMFVMQNMDMGKETLSTLSIKPLDYENDVAKFDITLLAETADDEMILNIEYSTKLFRKETIQKLGEHYINLLKAVVLLPEQTIKDIEMLSKDERIQIVEDFNQTQVEDTKYDTIQEIFEQQAAKYPEQVALWFNDEKMTYKVLNEKANGLARKLREKSVIAQTIVGIMMPRSIDMIVAILAIIKAGGAYLPIDITYPLARKKYMLEDSKAQLLIVNEAITEDLSFDGQLINLQEMLIEPCENLTCMNAVNDLAYIIYTSGSTGKPKGVMLEHKGLGNLKMFFQKEFNITHQDCIVQFASTSFDASVGKYLWHFIMAQHCV